MLLSCMIPGNRLLLLIWMWSIQHWRPTCLGPGVCASDFFLSCAKVLLVVSSMYPVRGDRLRVWGQVRLPTVSQKPRSMHSLASSLPNSQELAFWSMQSAQVGLLPTWVGLGDARSQR